MPRRSLLSSAEREILLALPESQDDLIRYYSLSESDLAIINRHRGQANRLGFAVQLCYMRFPGKVLEPSETPPLSLLQLVASQLEVSVESWTQYSQRPATRREHLLELQSHFGFQPFTSSDRHPVVQSLLPLALQTDKGITLATALLESLRSRSTLLPSINVVEQLCSEAVTRANRVSPRFVRRIIIRIYHIC